MLHPSRVGAAICSHVHSRDWVNIAVIRQVHLQEKDKPMCQNISRNSRASKVRFAFLLFVGLSTNFLATSTVIADIISFDLTNFADGSMTLSTTSDGVTLQFFDRRNNGNPTGFFADSDGVAFIGNDPLRFYTFQMDFDAPVELLSYTIGFVQGVENGDVFSLATSGGNTDESFPFSLGSRNFATQLLVAANDPIMVSTSEIADNDEIVQLSSITVQTIPEPSSLLMMTGIGLAALVGRRRRH